MLKNLPAMQESQVRSPGREDPLEWPPSPVFLPGESPWMGQPGGLQSWGDTESDMTEVTNT